MSREKRLLSPHSDISLPKRPKPLDFLTTDGPLTQKDVVFFKKEAIWRQMSAYKLKLDLLARDVERYKSVCELNVARLAILDSWYQQITDLFPASDASEDTASPDILISSIDDHSLDGVLQLRRGKLDKAIASVLRDANKDPDWANKVKLLSAELASARASNTLLAALNESLKAKTTELDLKICELHRERNRSELRTLLRVDETRHEPGSESVKSEPIKIEPGSNGSKLRTGLEPAEPIASVVKEEEDFSEMQQKLSLLSELNKGLKELLEQCEKKLFDALSDREKLSFRLDNLQEADLADNVLYKNAVAAHSTLQRQYDALQKANDENVRRLNELDSRQETWLEKVHKEYVSETESLRQHLCKQEQDLIRVRTIRDDLLAKNAILKLSLEESPCTQELVKLNQSLTARLEALEKPVATNPNAEAFEKLDHATLVERIVQLTAETVEIEAAFREVRQAALAKVLDAVDHESMIKKLSVEKTKADQKYFAAMRHKDAMTAEIRLLKTRVSKLQDVINTNAELEKLLRAKIDAMALQVKDYRQIKEMAHHENTKLEARCKAVCAVRDSLASQVKKNGETIEAKTHDLLIAQAQVSLLEARAAAAEKQLAHATLQLEKVKSGQALLLFDQDREQLEALRSIAKCSVCSKNWKNTVITVCGHVFCQECANERLAARLRRCPSCNKGFLANDLLTVHL